jgi:hypothetical protein
MSNRSEVEELLESWSQEPNQAKNIINCLIEFLTDDLYWLNENIKDSDRELFYSVANHVYKTESN